jgi:hypothetical protein
MVVPVLDLAGILPIDKAVGGHTVRGSDTHCHLQSTETCCMDKTKSIDKVGMVGTNRKDEDALPPVVRYLSWHYKYKKYCCYQYSTAIAIATAAVPRVVDWLP